VTNTPLATALFAGMLVSLSSTAIVMRVLAEKGELEAPHGRAALGILIFQDLAIVLMVLLVPFLGTGQVEPLEFGWVIVKSLLFVGGALLAARYAVPHMLEFVANTRTRETFILATILLVLGTAWLSARMGLSLSLGAFVAGLVVSESEYSH
jgi:CPA2 family monovalent cation:H+ antiporter-2